jgi:hypothetical protein
MAFEIVNCTWKFQFQCPRRWDSLVKTDESNVRICESCLEPVYFCSSEEELRLRSKRVECVYAGFWGPDEPQMLGKVISKS